MAAAKIRSVKYNAVMNFLLTASAMLFPLVTFPYVTRVLFVEGNGRQAFANSVVQYFIMIAALGIPTYGIRACARIRNDKEALSRTFFELLILNVITMALSYVMLFACISFIPRLQEERTLLYINAVAILLNTIGIDWLFQGLEQYTYITIRNIAFKVLALILMFVLVKRPTDLYIYAAIYVLATQGSAVLNFLKSHEYVSFPRLSSIHPFMHIKPVLVFFGMAAATSIYYSLTTAMLGFLNTNTQVGFFDAAARIKNILILAVSTLGNVLLPRLSFYYEQHEHEKIQRLLNKAFDFVFSASSCLAVFFIIYANDIVIILCGQGYMGATSALQALMPAIIFVGLSTTTGMQMLVPSGREKIVLISTVIGAAVALLLNFLLLGPLGAVGASLVVSITELTVLLVQCIALRHTIRRLLPQVHFLQIVLALALPMSASLILHWFWDINAVVSVALGFVIIFGGFAAMLCAQRVPIAVEALRMFGHAFRKHVPTHRKG